MFLCTSLQKFDPVLRGTPESEQYERYMIKRMALLLLLLLLFFYYYRHYHRYFFCIASAVD